MDCRFGIIIAALVMLVAAVEVALPLNPIMAVAGIAAAIALGFFAVVWWSE